MLFPLSAIRVHSLERPSIETSSRKKRICVPNALPDLFWQARQWQTDTRTGSPTTVALSWPQRHEAVRIVTWRLS
jgi:hypothetical protein